MDGKLTGRLSLKRQLTGRLSAMQREAPVVVLVPKEIRENGTYRAVDDQADGYSEVVVDVPAKAEPIAPYRFDLTGGYVSAGAWTPGGDTVNYSDVYKVRADTAYLLMLGKEAGSRFRSMFSEKDISTATAKITGKSITNESNPSPYAFGTYKPMADGFITVTKDNAGVSGLKTYLFRLEDLV